MKSKTAGSFAVISRSVWNGILLSTTIIIHHNPGSIITNNILYGYKLNQIVDLIETYDFDDLEFYIDRLGKDNDQFSVYKNHVIQIIT